MIFTPRIFYYIVATHVVEVFSKLNFSDFFFNFSDLSYIHF